MTDERQVLHEVREALDSELRFRPNKDMDVDVAFSDGALTITGEVATVAVKKRLLARAAAHPAVTGVVDRLRVEPAERMGDDQIRTLVRDALLQESSLAQLAVREWDAGELKVVREPPEGARGNIGLSVEDGVVTLDGDAPTLAHKRLAGVLAWWVPGSRDVINGLGVTSPETDLDAEVTDVVRMVLEKDPFVEASQIRVLTQRGKVILHGLVPTDSEREMAELDAWYVFGVDEVENKVEVRP